MITRPIPPPSWLRLLSTLSFYDFSFFFRFHISRNSFSICLCLSYITWHNVLKVHLCCPKYQDCSLPGSSVHGASPGKKTGAGCHAFPPGDLPNLGIKPRSPALQGILYCLSQQRTPRILEWVAYPFSRGFSWPRNRTRIFYISGRFFTSWATRACVCVCVCVCVFTTSSLSVICWWICVYTSWLLWIMLQWTWECR